MFVYRIDKEVSLKLLDLQDAEGLFELTDQSRNYLREWLPWVDATAKLEDSQAFIRQSLQGFADGKSMSAGILVNGELAGIAGYNTLDRANQHAVIGYWLGENFQGKGVMTKVAAALTDYAFKTLHLNRVEIRAAAGNTKSRRIPEKLGYVNEGSSRQAEWLYDHYVDHAIYGMLAEEWTGTPRV